LTKSEILDLFELLVSHLALNGMVIVHCPNGDSSFVGSVRDVDFTHTTALPTAAHEINARFSN
jgi:hypothetical protein